MNNQQNAQEPEVFEVTQAMIDAVAELIGLPRFIANTESLLSQLFDNQIKLETRIRKLEGEATIQVLAKSNVDIANGTMEVIHTRTLPESLRVPGGIWEERGIIQNGKPRS